MAAIQGDVSPGFEAVALAFQQLLSDFGEQGAGVCLVHHGEVVVDLWAGTRDKAENLPWQADTRSNIFSASKALVAIAVLQLVDRNLLHLDQTIASVWPEFGGQGKSKITVRDLLCHRSGVNAFHAKIEDDAIYDWQRITSAIASEEPWWEPGSEQGYSPMLYGWILGEVVCRVSQCSSFDDYVQQFIAKPLELTCQFGLSLDQLDTVADVVPMKRIQASSGGSLVEVIRANPRGVTNRAFSNPSSLMIGTNKPAWRQAQIPAANGQASARDLAQFYASLSDLSDTRLLSAEHRQWLWNEQSSGQDKVLHNPLSFSLGFMRLLPSTIQSECYFCHPGAGGSLGYGDAKEGFGFGFVSRVMGQAILMDERADHLLQSVYQCVRGA
ncbi:MAG: serine hydrolase domain-containing protein [Cellvibrionaceae bacterium]